MKTWIYPGSLWMKRFKHCLVVSAITLTLWVDQVQQTLFVLTKEVTTTAHQYTPSIERLCQIIEQIIPTYKRIENSKLGKTFGENKIISSDTIRIEMDRVRKARAHILSMPPMLKIVALVLKITAILMFIQIAYSSLWMVCDVRYGHAKLFTVLLIVCAVIINLKTKTTLETLIF